MEKSATASPVVLYAGFTAFVTVFSLARVFLCASMAAVPFSILAAVLDFFTALGTGLLVWVLSTVCIPAAGATLFVLCIYLIANVEMIASLHTVVNLVDLPYTLDASFFAGSAAGIRFKLYAVLLALSALVYLWSLVKGRHAAPVRRLYGLAGGAACIVLALLLTPPSAEWDSGSILLESVSLSVGSAIASGESGDAESASLIAEDSSPRAGRTGGRSDRDPGGRYFERSADGARNVLLLVLEGIPGAYVRGVKEWTGTDHPFEMPALSRLAERSLVVPNFFNHSRQTVRGLYSMLSGDYSKLNLTTPKIYEYLEIPPRERAPCLPEVLSAAGYRTAFLQASDLSYMSKDQFMPAAGFETVLGSESLGRGYVPFGWGLDDRAFLQQAFEFVRRFDGEPEPWFISLLTVGTHHPYGVSGDFARGFPNEKAAAVAYLDDALDEFFRDLASSGILESTLVLVVSDESHGVAGHPYGRYWGLAVAHAPESRGVVNPGVYGLIDVPFSVLDYLGLAEKDHPFQPVSFFRGPSGDRTVLFETGMSTEKGIVLERNDSASVNSMRTANGEMFSPRYEETLIAGERGRELAAELRQAHRAANGSLMDPARGEREYVLMQDDSFVLDPGERNVLSTGQYLDIPSESTVTVRLKAGVETAAEAGSRQGQGAATLELLMIHWYEKMPIPEVDMPVLSAGQTLDLAFDFSTESSLYRVWAYLRADSLAERERLIVTIDSFSIETRDRSAASDFRIRRFVIE